ncbi:MAG: hypothetical protein CMF23_17440 [Ignavibacteriae bacterium]|nr:hypothetical protein [Ignavibacteriota bacterium]|tara:strand:+ start:194 stop:1015 length:822 start_codon:yes stop_codon:yes gene_type:complete
MSVQNSNIINNYFVDEAGDLTLFDKKGRIIVGNEGISKCFMVGFAYVPEPTLAKSKLENLRKELLADPYFKDVPSMQPHAKKTALIFHAKNDLPEVRREVFKILLSLNVKVQIAIRRKKDLALKLKWLFETKKEKLSDNDIYDDLVKRLFRNSLHKADENIIHFARRGNSTRNTALQSSIDKAKANFQAKYNKTINKPVKIIPAYPNEYIGLQIIDYYLWAVQRLYEKGEDRFFQLLANDFRLIMDLDDIRNKDYGEWYSDQNKLDLKKIKPV